MKMKVCPPLKQHPISSILIGILILGIEKFERYKHWARHHIDMVTLVSSLSQKTREKRWHQILIGGGGGGY